MGVGQPLPCLFQSSDWEGKGCLSTLTPPPPPAAPPHLSPYTPTFCKGLSLLAVSTSTLPTPPLGLPQPGTPAPTGQNPLGCFPGLLSPAAPSSGIASFTFEGVCVMGVISLNPSPMSPGHLHLVARQASVLTQTHHPTWHCAVISVSSDGAVPFIPLCQL